MHMARTAGHPGNSKTAFGRGRVSTFDHTKAAMTATGDPTAEDVRCDGLQCAIGYASGRGMRLRFGHPGRYEIIDRVGR